MFFNKCKFCGKKFDKESEKRSLFLKVNGAQATSICCLGCYDDEKLKKRGWSKGEKI